MKIKGGATYSNSAGRPRRYLLLFVLCLSLLPSSCRRLPDLFDNDDVVAKVGKSALHRSDIVGTIPAGITGADSLQWVESYTSRWVRDQLKLQEAKELFGSDAADEELVQNYRNTLLLRRLEQYYIERRLNDSTYTEKELRDYYEQNKSEFVLDRTIVRGRILVVPSSFPRKSRVRELFTDFTPGNRDDLAAIAEKSGLDFNEVTDWVDYSKFLSLLPTRRNESYDYLLDKSQVTEMTDGGLTYYFIITDYRTPGMASPYETVVGMVRWAVSARHKSAIIKSHEDSLYNIALRDRRATINLENDTPQQ